MNRINITKSVKRVSREERKPILPGNTSGHETDISVCTDAMGISCVYVYGWKKEEERKDTSS